MTGIDDGDAQFVGGVDLMVLDLTGQQRVRADGSRGKNIRAACAAGDCQPSDSTLALRVAESSATERALDLFRQFFDGDRFLKIAEKQAFALRRASDLLEAVTG